MIADATYDDAAVKADIKTNADAIGVLNGTETVEGSVKKTVNDAIKALNSIYGTELMADNTNECRNRLYLIFKEYCDKKNLTLEQFELAKRKCLNILKKNIVCTDTFKWNYDEWKPMNEPEQLNLFNE